MKKGFTLIELIMVVALIAIVSSLAVMRIGNLRERSARTVSLANQSAISRAVDAFLAVTPNGQIDYLDSLLTDRGGVATMEGNGAGVQRTLRAADYCYRGAGSIEGIDRSEDNAGLTPRLYGPGAEGGNVFVPYSLSGAEVTRLANRGFKYVMRHVTGDMLATLPEVGDDQVRISADATTVLDPHKSACIARAVTNGMIVCAISPFTKNGRDIYRDCGQKLLDTTDVTDASGMATDEDKAIAQMNATGGALLAFGLGSDATLIGNGLAGLESVPYATYPVSKYYRQYILLFHVDTSTPAGRLDFRGVLDPCGFTTRVAREAIR
ncbi:MAG: type II secretion system protein [Kiritimatiellia bacterium]